MVEQLSYAFGKEVAKGVEKNINEVEKSDKISEEMNGETKCVRYEREYNIFKNS